MIVDTLTPPDRKQQIREQAHAARRALEHKDDLSRRIMTRVLSLPEFERAGTVMFYIDVRAEVRTRHRGERRLRTRAIEGVGVATLVFDRGAQRVGEPAGDRRRVGRRRARCNRGRADVAGTESRRKRQRDADEKDTYNIHAQSLRTAFPGVKRRCGTILTHSLSVPSAGCVPEPHGDALEKGTP